MKGDYTPMTNIDGRVCLGSFCPNDIKYQEYIKSLYKMVAEAKPDYIWIDDDIRSGYMPIGNGCFCDNCLKIFARKYGHEYTRESLKKADNITLLEACSHISAGCTGAAFNVLSGYDETLDEYEPLVARIKEMRPFFDLLARNLGRSPCTGIQTFWNKESYSTENLEKGNWTESGNPVVTHEFGDIGLPVCYSSKDAVVTILGKDNIYALSKEEIGKLLTGGVYMDAGTLQQLNDMGLGDLTGFEVTGQESRDRIEKFTDHPLNGSFAGRERNNRQSFWKLPAYSLRKTDQNAEILSFLIDYSGAEVSSCTSGIFVNKLGGRICVAGYYPWTYMENLSKSSQMKSVFRWLSKDQLPAYIASFHKNNLRIRKPLNGKTALTLANDTHFQSIIGRETES